jgi:hypothetical protein
MQFSGQSPITRLPVSPPIALQTALDTRQLFDEAGTRCTELPELCGIQRRSKRPFETMIGMSPELSNTAPTRD